MLNVLASIKSHKPNCLDNLKMAAMILEKVAEESSDELHSVASFTAEQMKLVTEPLNGRRYSSILMSNSVMWERLNYANRVPIQLNCSKSDSSLKFIEDFGLFMRSWFEKSNIPLFKKLSKDTCMAVFHSSRGLIHLAKYLLEHYVELDYILATWKNSV